MGLEPWVIVGPEGLAYVGLHKSEDELWQIFLGWPSEDEIQWHKDRGWRAYRATVTWTEGR